MTLKISNISDFIPHRYENILLDTIYKEADTNLEGSLELKITENDSLNRQIFFKKDHENKTVLITPFFMEIMALAAIVIYNNTDTNKTAVFVSISSFEFFNAIQINETISGNVEFLNTKKGFITCKGLLNNNNKELCKGNLSAFFVDINEKKPDVKPSDIDLTEKNKINYNKSSRNKEESMIMCDSIIDYSDTSLLATFNYSKDHPLVKGHFPGNPIMMGVMQWLSIEDCMCHYLEITNQTGNNSFSCTASIYNQNKIKIADIKNIILETWINVESVMNQTNILKTGKINFRNMVSPEDTLFISISNITKQ